MYLVEIEAGRERLYESTATFAAAIRSGEITPASRVFHRAKSSWISVTLHPEYRKAVAARASEPLPPLARNQWTFFGVEPLGREIVEAPAASQQEASSEPETGRRRGLRGLFSRARRGRPTGSESPEPSSS